MAELKFNLEMDGIGWLYRSALFLAQEKEKEAIIFLDKANNQLNKYINKDFIALINSPEKYLTNRKQKCFWAEKVLDEYHRICRLLR